MRARSQHLRAKVLTLGTLVALSMLPPAWLAPWSGDVATIVSFPLWPLERAFGWIRSSVRPAPGPRDSEAAIDERLEELTVDREHYRALWFAERVRSAELEERLLAIEKVRRADRSAARPVSASIVAHPPVPGSGLFAVDAGAESGVHAGDPVVTDGDRLVGRITGDPSEHRAFMAPLTHASIGLIDALVEPAPRADAKPNETTVFVRIQLAPAKGDRFTGEVAVGSGVRVGDVVRLEDPAWPRAAQGLRIGIVRSLTPLERNPLRLAVDVEPEVPALRAGQVVVKCEDGP